MPVTATVTSDGARQMFAAAAVTVALITTTIREQHPWPHHKVSAVVHVQAAARQGSNWPPTASSSQAFMMSVANLAGLLVLVSDGCRSHWHGAE